MVSGGVGLAGVTDTIAVWSGVDLALDSIPGVPLALSKLALSIVVAVIISLIAFSAAILVSLIASNCSEEAVKEDDATVSPDDPRSPPKNGDVGIDVVLISAPNVPGKDPEPSRKKETLLSWLLF